MSIIFCLSPLQLTHNHNFTILSPQKSISNPKKITTGRSGNPHEGRGGDFSGISDDPSGLAISKVIHRARIRVDEQGTEAAAATALVMCVGVPEADGSLPIPFIVNRPFLFMIRDDQTKAILFAGRVTNPAD